MTAIIGYMIASVIVRYFFHGAIPYLSAVPNMFYVYVCLGAAYAYNQRSFMIVDVLYNRFSVRQKAALDLATSFFFFIFLGSLLYVSAGYAFAAAAKFKFDPAILIDPTRWPITIVFPLGPLLLLIAGLMRFIRNVIILIGMREQVGIEAESAAIPEEVQAK